MNSPQSIFLKYTPRNNWNLLQGPDTLEEQSTYLTLCARLSSHSGRMSPVSMSNVIIGLVIHQWLSSHLLSHGLSHYRDTNINTHPWSHYGTRYTSLVTVDMMSFNLGLLSLYIPQGDVSDKRPKYVMDCGPLDYHRRFTT